MTPEPATAALEGWDSFYVIIGSSSGALIGLQFVVVTLLSETRANRAPEAISAFGTPTVVHFSGALLISALMTAPWSSQMAVKLALATCGIVGTGYGARVLLHAVRQSSYEPELVDWLWYLALPGCAYLVLIVAAALLPGRAVVAADLIAAAAAGLLLSGIHNAWDTVTYIVFTAPRTSNGGVDQ